DLLELSAEPACWRSYGGIGAQGPATVKPDSYVRLGVGDYEDSFFVEVDQGTEGSQTLDRKLKEYVAYEASGTEQDRHGVFPRVLWLAPDADRAEVIERCIGQLPAASRELFAVAVQADVLDAVSGTAKATHS
ncbi:MAG TPA: replication-relaxation family protein, partial [Solirubrobacterales bacterium]